MRRLALWIAMLMAGNALWAQGVRLQVGDLLFFADTADMGGAIQESTGRYTHVAMVAEVGDTVWIIDATRRHGVSRRPLESGDACADAYRLAIAFDTAAVLERAMGCIGMAYDEAFLPGNGMMYCSELIHECYRAADGAPLFEAKPMNWRDKEGRMPQYWTAHFERLGMPIPEGVPGTNPAEMAQSPLLRRL